MKKFEIETASPARAWRLGVMVAAFAAALWAGSAVAQEPAKGDGAKTAPAAEQPAGAAPAAMSKEDEGEADWPCEQKFVAELSPATIWAGPPLDTAMKSWHQNDSLREIVTDLTDDTLEPEDGVKEIDAFAAKLAGDKNKTLTELFAALFETISNRRTSVQDGIKKFFRRQEAVADRVNGLQKDMRALTGKGAKPSDPEYLDLEKEITWRNRVYDEGQKLVPYMCEIPVLMEQKLGAYARAIQADMS